MPWSKVQVYIMLKLCFIGKHYKFSLTDKWKKIPKKIQEIILYGSDDEEIKFSYDDNYETYTTKKPFEGVINNLERRYLETVVSGKEKKYLNINLSLIAINVRALD